MINNKVRELIDNELIYAAIRDEIDEKKILERIQKLENEEQKNEELKRELGIILKEKGDEFYLFHEKLGCKFEKNMPCIIYYKKGLELGNSLAGARLGYIYMDFEEETEKAEEYLKKSINLGSIVSKVLLGDLYKKMNKLDEALNMYKEALEIYKKEYPEGAKRLEEIIEELSKKNNN